jgi:hypothetical protein
MSFNGFYGLDIGQSNNAGRGSIAQMDDYINDFDENHYFDCKRHQLRERYIDYLFYFDPIDCWSNELVSLDDES